MVKRETIVGVKASLALFQATAAVQLFLVLASVSFAFGILFVCFTVDHKLLFGALTEQAVEDGFFFYTTFYNSPPVIKLVLHSMAGFGVLGLITKLHKWDESAMFFDGSSLALYIFALGVYLTVSIPSLRTIVDPIVGVDTQSDRIEAMRVLGAGNTIIMVLLGAVLCLQAGEEYARRYEAKVMAGVTEKEPKAAAPSAEKKTQ
ncbi:Shr3 amino acid permease chaperone [Pyrrhoderma noxium]|uniref:Shr3 amino acid permease chaperone n=1 Tax=Pyrrhoderma noxium TaxID=2282107 RepID=A0A286UKG5_9AGAM|nr:Shr3 amino acid permease chaperone [Pyrrhoderma noxium]